MAIAAGLRVFQLGDEGLWFDEANTAVLSQLSVGHLIERITVDNQAPLYFLLVKAITAVFGSTEWALRSVSAAAGVAAVWLSYDVGRRLLSPNAGRWAAVLLAVSPMAVHYSQEARPYSILMLLVLVAFRVAWVVDDRLSVSSASLLAAVFVVTSLMHNIGLVYVASLTAVFVLSGSRNSSRLRLWALVVALTFLGYLVWLPNMVQQTIGMEQSFAWASGIWKNEYPWQIPRSLAAMTHGSLAPIRNRVPELPWTAWAALGLCSLTWCAAFFRRQTFTGWRAPTRLAAASVLPLGIMWVYSILAATPMYLVGRVDSPAVPLFLLLGAGGAAALRKPLSWLVPIAFVCLAILPLRVHWSIDFKSQERNIAQFIDRHRRPHEPLITTAFDCSFIHYSHLRHDETLFLYPSKTEPYLGWVNWGRYDLSRLVSDAVAVADRATARARGSGAERVWLLLHPDQRYAPIADELDRRLMLSGEVDFGFLGVTLRVYEMPEGAGEHAAPCPPEPMPNARCSTLDPTPTPFRAPGSYPSNSSDHSSIEARLPGRAGGGTTCHVLLESYNPRGRHHETDSPRIPRDRLLHAARSSG